jgi:hypothetical protein
MAKKKIGKWLDYNKLYKQWRIILRAKNDNDLREIYDDISEALAGKKVKFVAKQERTNNGYNKPVYIWFISGSLSLQEQQSIYDVFIKHEQ